MRVLWLAHRDLGHPRAGGAERTIYEVGSRLVSYGHSVTLICSRWPGAPREDYSSGIRVLRYPGMIGPHFGASLSRNSGNADVVVDDLAHAVPWGTRWLSSVPGLAFFHHLHSRTLPGQTDPVSRGLLSALERLYPFLYQRWPFVTESRSARRDLIELGVSETLVHQILPGVDLTVFRPGPKVMRPQIVYFAGFRRYKRPRLAVDVFRRVRGLGFDARLVMIGTGPELAATVDYVRTLGLSASVEFAGRASDSDVARIVRESWLNLHTSIAEGWGFSIAESSASGTPTVAFSVPGVVDSLSEGLTGHLVPDGDVAGLAAACAEVLHAPDTWAARCCRAGRLRDWSTTAMEWETLLQGVQAGR
jgi:glycosyltransferase involved in cell wall biosynthesis